MTGLSNRWGWPCLVGLTWSVLLFLVLPILVTIPVSVTPHNYLSLPDGPISFQHYHTLFTDPIWQSSVLQSLTIGAIVTVVSVTIGTLAAIGLWRLSSQLGEAVRVLALAPMIVPPVVSALAFYRFFASLDLIDTLLGVVIAHTLLAVPYVLVAVSAALATLDQRQEQASRSLGASLIQTIRHVILPQIQPGMMAGAVFAFIISWDEIVVTLFIASRAVYTLPRKMWDGINERVDPTIAAAATVLFAVTLVLIGLQVLKQAHDTRPSAESSGGGASA
jgi:putative spermidine/putrescine transport system permease protein